MRNLLVHERALGCEHEARLVAACVTGAAAKLLAQAQRVRLACDVGEGGLGAACIRLFDGLANGLQVARLKVRGMFVSPLEIEDCIATHPAIRECAVIGALDEEGMTVPKAVCVLREGHEVSDATIASIQEHAKAHLARYKFPRIVRFMDALPRNDRGKVVRRALESV